MHLRPRQVGYRLPYDPEKSQGSRPNAKWGEGGTRTRLGGPQPPVLAVTLPSQQNW